MSGLFDGKVVLVTGAGSGIGQAAAHLFAREGARVVAADIGEASARATAEQVRAGGGQAIHFHGDVADSATVQRMVGAVVAEYGRLDCAFNNAGITHGKDHEWDEDGFQRVMDVNTKSIMLCMKYEIAQMLTTGGGTIVNTASVAGLIASASVPQPAYTASKHAVIGLTKSAALAYARQNIRVNALLPGVTRTPILDDVMAIGPEARHTLENFAPMGRMGTAEEMAECAIWLCSAKSSFVTGHSLVADGGYTAQ